MIGSKPYLSPEPTRHWLERSGLTYQDVQVTLMGFAGDAVDVRVGDTRRWFNRADLSYPI